MRHLRVPSAQTQRWLLHCKANGWLAEGPVRPLFDEHRGLPLNSTAPSDDHPAWEGLDVVALEPVTSAPSHWTDRLPEPLRNLPSSIWPSAYELQGDVLMVKLEEEAEPHADEVAKAMLAQLPNVRLVCADHGVSGDFRVRSLRPIASRNGDMSTKTTVREHGFTMDVDPAVAYFSSRLSTQREHTLEAIRALRRVRDEPLVVADPYAGVGPVFPLLLAEPGLVGGWLAGDLNPDAVALLEENLARWSAGKGHEPSTTVCMDALSWADDPTLREQADVLLVNLPHDSIDHLPYLLPLLATHRPVLIRGWAIRPRGAEAVDNDLIRDMCTGGGMVVERVTVAPVKGFSSTKAFVVFEVHGQVQQAFSS